MEKQTNKFKYAQLERFKESIELEHLKRKTIIVNILMIAFALCLTYFLFRDEVEPRKIYPAIIMLVIIIIINWVFASLEFDLYSNLKLAMYITIMGVFSTTLLLVLTFMTPSIFTLLFFAYAVASVYQDNKSMMLSSLSLMITGTILILKNPSMFSLVGNTSPQIFYVLVFLIVFVMLLTLSSYILIKRKTFFYNQIASIKESEIRNILLAEEMASLKSKHQIDVNEYFTSLKTFSDHLSEKIGIENVFSRKIDILKDLQIKKPIELLDKYKDYNLEELEALNLMELKVNEKMMILAEKASKSNDIIVSRKEIFSEAQFKSFAHYYDSTYTKIISFAVFYTLLKLDKQYLKGLEDEEIKDILYNSEFFYKIDRSIIDVYLNNNDVFNTIVDDYMKGGM